MMNPADAPVCPRHADVMFDIAAIVLVRRLRRRREERAEGERRPRSCWTRQWLSRRLEYGWYDTLMSELEREDAPTFRNFLRVDVALFRELLESVGPAMEPIGCNYRDPLPPGLKLAITLRHFATGDSYATLSFGFRVARNTIHYMIKQVSTAIVDTYRDEMLTPPSTAQGWRDIAQQFTDKWQFHHTLGAIDGKHVGLRNPPKSGSLYYNYKGFYSIVLLAICDADYKFIWVDVGAQGSASDAQIFNHTNLERAIEENWMDIPGDAPLPQDDGDTPYFFIGDDAFALKTWMMKPFSRRNLTREERIFNYRLSRARRVVENAFGILSNRFRCLLGRLQQQPGLVVQMVTAMLCLHNVMRARYPALQNAALPDAEGDDHRPADQAAEQDVGLLGLPNIRAPNEGTIEVKQQRENLKVYYTDGEGARLCPWQNNVA